MGAWAAKHTEIDDNHGQHTEIDDNHGQHTEIDDNHGQHTEIDDNHGQHTEIDDNGQHTEIDDNGQHTEIDDNHGQHTEIDDNEEHTEIICDRCQPCESGIYILEYYNGVIYISRLPFSGGKNNKYSFRPRSAISVPEDGDIHPFPPLRNRRDKIAGVCNYPKYQICEQNKAPSITTLYDLPLEVLDIILQKSYLHWILNSSTKQRDEEILKNLASVDVCFNRRITGQRRFKKAIWRYLKDFYGKTRKRSTIIRNNRNYLLENIQPNSEFIDSLFSLNCITEEQSHFIQRQRLIQDKNAELLHVLRSFDDKKFSTFIKCLRQTNQTTVARVVRNGGAVIKVEVKNFGTAYTESMDPQLLHQRINDFQNRTKSRSHETDELIRQLKEEDIEFLNTQQTVVVWIWCRSQAALENIQRLYESNQLKDVFFGCENIRPSTSENIDAIVINIDQNQMNKTVVVVSPVSVNLTGRINVGRNETVVGVTKLRNEIYVLCQQFPHVIHVFEGRNPFRLQMKIYINEIEDPKDIGSSEKENCLYVSDQREKCVWKITRQTDYQHNIIKWLTIDYESLTLSGRRTRDEDPTITRETDYQHEIIKWLTIDYAPHALSVSSNGHLLLVTSWSPILNIYGSDAELIRSIQLPRDIENSIHAVETSNGNVIILHQWMENEERESGPGGRIKKRMWVVSELTRDGQMVVHRFIPSNETQKLKNPEYLSLDSDDQVFVADTGNDRMILLDSDLTWNRSLCPSAEEEELEDEDQEQETKIRRPLRSYYDERKKQLIVGGGYFYSGGFNIYTLSQK